MTFPNALLDPSQRPTQGISDRFYDLLRETWGFDSLRPSQVAAIESVLNGRDSLVVMPTGGGKSLCYQAPAVFRGGMTIVVSPLIALMKDQVDSLIQLGVAAVRIDSTLVSAEKQTAAAQIRSGNVRLLFASPERLMNPDFIRFLSGNEVHTIAIDEAHCVSQWGHDFRPEYRQLSTLREAFPMAAMHAFTATATEKVQRDIIEQLRLRDPKRLVSSFDRPNLTYRILPQSNLQHQIQEVCERHRGSGGIVYCLRRADVESTTSFLQRAGFSVVGYHAGMSNEERKLAQEAFLSESVDVVVATVAFGMGIDRSNVRYVVHASIPKSIEHYQQETGRAGRDGLPAECVLFHSVADVITLKTITESSLREANAAEDIIQAARNQIEEISRYCRTPRCRHRALVQYFGQPYEKENCEACDVCLGDTYDVPDAKVISQKILSCVYRVQERFGVNHVVEVLLGAKTASILQKGHDKLSTHGILKEIPKTQLRDWVYQLVGQDALELDAGEYPILRLNANSKKILFGDAAPKLIRSAVKEKQRRQATASEAASHADQGLFEALRVLRRKIAVEQNVPPFVVFSDSTLLDMSATRPSSPTEMLSVSGIGRVKMETYGTVFLEEIDRYCVANRLNRDVQWKSVSRESGARPVRSSSTGTKAVTIPLLRQGLSIDEIANKAGIVPGTVVSHLLDWMQEEPLASIDPWVSPMVQQQVIAAANIVGRERLKPIFEHLEQSIPYETIRLVLSFEKATDL
jgi:ATP-dependent DNA helicase RecQ